MITDPEGTADLASREVRSGSRNGSPTKIAVARRTYPTNQADLWDTLANAERIPRWFLPVSGDLQVGGRYQLEGNAGGVVESCEEPRSFAVTWEMGPMVSWLEVTLTPGDAGTILELVHEAHVDPALWGQFGPGAVGLGWDLALMGLGLHLESGARSTRPRAPPSRPRPTASRSSGGRRRSGPTPRSPMATSRTRRRRRWPRGGLLHNSARGRSWRLSEPNLRALGDSTRRHILELLSAVSGRPGGRRLAPGSAPISQPGVSQHLKALREAGLVTVRAEGTRRLYALDEAGLDAARRGSPSSPIRSGSSRNHLTPWRRRSHAAAGLGGREPVNAPAQMMRAAVGANRKLPERRTSLLTAAQAVPRRSLRRCVATIKDAATRAGLRCSPQSGGPRQLPIGWAYHSEE